MSEAVPTSIRAYGDRLLVTLLSGAPFVDQASRVMDVNPVTGSAAEFITLLASTIDVVHRTKASGAGQFLVLEYSAALLQAKPGRLLAYDSPDGQIMTDNLPTPSAMAFDQESGNLYITSRGDGTVSMIKLGN